MLSGGQLKDPNSWFHATSPAAVAGYQLTVAVAFCIGIAAVSHDQLLTRVDEDTLLQLQ